MHPRGEPALWVGIVSAVLSLLVSFRLEWLSATQAALIVAAISAVGGVITAVLTRPVAPAAFTALTAAVADLIAAYGFHVSQQTVGAINGVILAVLVLLTRAQVSPTSAVASSGPRRNANLRA